MYAHRRRSTSACPSCLRRSPAFHRNLEEREGEVRREADAAQERGRTAYIFFYDLPGRRNSSVIPRRRCWGRAAELTGAGHVTARPSRPPSSAAPLPGCRRRRRRRSSGGGGGGGGGGSAALRLRGFADVAAPADGPGGRGAGGRAGRRHDSALPPRGCRLAKSRTADARRSGNTARIYGATTRYRGGGRFNERRSALSMYIYTKR